MTKYRYTLEGKSNGFVYSNLLRKEKLEEFEFPVSAFRDFCNRKGIPFPFDYEETVQVKEVVTDEQEKLADDDLEIIEGVTVGELRSYLKEDSPEYLPRLPVILKAKKELIEKRDLKDGAGFRRYKGTGIKELAERIAVDKLKEMGMFTDVDMRAVSRILCRDKQPNNGTGGSY